MPDNTKHRVLISGAGIGGLTAAYWMNHIGWDVVVLEKSDKLREGEFVIDFAGTGWDVAAKMGIDQAIKAKETKIATMSLRSDQGVESSKISMADFVDTLGVGEKHASINRRDLQNLLYDKIRDTVEVRFSSSIQSLKEAPGDDVVHVTFEDGTAEQFDLVIGADGLHSNVRGLAFGDEKQYSRYLGYSIAAFRAPATFGNDPHVMALLRSPNKQAGILDLGDGESLGFFVFAEDNPRYVPAQDRPTVLKQQFAGMGGAVPTIMNSITDDTYVYLDSTTQIVMPTWHTNRVALIGDAAYCLTLVSGQGASMAMGGAYMLAEEIHNAPDGNVPAALANYDARMRPFVTGMQEKSRKFAAQFIASSKVGIWVADRMMALATNPLAKRFIGGQFSVQSLFEKEAEEGRVIPKSLA